VQAERPAVLHEQLHNALQLGFERLRQVRARLEKVFEVRGGEHQHFARTVHAQELVTVAGLRHLHPASEVVDLLLRVLREQVVGDAHGQLAALREFHDDGVVVGVGLVAAARVDGARHAEPVQLAHEMARRIHLVVIRQLRAFGERGVEQARIGARDQHARGVAAAVALDLAAGRVRRVFRVAHGAQRGGVQERAVVEVEDEHRRVGRNGVDLFERGPAAFGELQLVPAAHHAHPLRGRRAGHLAAQHVERVGERGHAVPAQLHVEVEAAANHVQVRVVEPRNHGAALQVDAPRVGARALHHVAVVARGEHAAVLDGQRRDERALFVLGRNLAVEEDRIRGRRVVELGSHRAFL
jgi:hypothetical protein